MRAYLRRKINLSQVFAGQNVGIKEIAEKIWLVSFMHYDLGFFDHETGRVECAENPFGAKVSAVSMDHRNTGSENIRWSLPSQSFPRPGI
jgi:putative transposase